MPSALQKQNLSGSTSGEPISITSTSGTGQTIHTAVSGTTQGTWSEIYIYAMNNSTSAVVVTLQWGGTGASQLIAVSVPPIGSVPLLIADGWLLQNSLVVTAIAGTTAVITLTGFVNAITN